MDRDELAALDVDGGFGAERLEKVETLWANLPTARAWTSLGTHEKALVVHQLGALIDENARLRETLESIEARSLVA